MLSAFLWAVLQAAPAGDAGMADPWTGDLKLHSPVELATNCSGLPSVLSVKPAGVVADSLGWRWAASVPKGGTTSNCTVEFTDHEEMHPVMQANIRVVTTTLRCGDTVVSAEMGKEIPGLEIPQLKGRSVAFLTESLVNALAEKLCAVPLKIEVMDTRDKADQTPSAEGVRDAVVQTLQKQGVQATDTAPMTLRFELKRVTQRQGRDILNCAHVSASLLNPAKPFLPAIPVSSQKCVATTPQMASDQGTNQQFAGAAVVQGIKNALNAKGNLASADAYAASLADVIANLTPRIARLRTGR